MAQNKQAQEAVVEEAVNKTEEFLIQNKKTIISVIVALIVLVGGVVAYKYLYAIPREHKAQVALFPGESYFENGDYETALNGDSILFKGLLNVADEFSGTDAANLANAYAGLCQAHLGNYAEAIKLLDKFSGSDAMVAPAIKAAIGNCYAETENYDKATSYLTKAAKEADSNTLSPIWLMQAGEIFEKQQKYDDAIKVYTEIKDTYFRSYQAMSIDKYIDRAKMQKK